MIFSPFKLFQYLLVVATLATPLILTNPESISEMRYSFALLFTGVIFLLTIIVDLTYHLYTIKKFLAVRESFLTAARERFRSTLVEQFNEETVKDVRVSIVFLRRCLFFPILKHFEYVLRLNFTDTDPDHNRYLFCLQGLQGKVAKTGEPDFINFCGKDISHMNSDEREAYRKKYKLFRWQMRKVPNIKATICVPCLQYRGVQAEEVIRTVGTISIDARTKEVADLLFQPESFKKITTDMLEQGKTIAIFAV